MGDGALIEFASLVDGVEGAATIQKGVAGRQVEERDRQRIRFRTWRSRLAASFATTLVV